MAASSRARSSGWRRWATGSSKYGETIYGTRGGPWKPGKSIASTRKGNTIYVHLLGYNGKTVTLPNIPRKIIASSVLTGGTARVQPGSAAKSQSALIPRPRARRLTAPNCCCPPEPGRSNPPQIDCILKLELDGSAMDLEPL